MRNSFSILSLLVCFVVSTSLDPSIANGSDQPTPAIVAVQKSPYQGRTYYATIEWKDIENSTKWNGDGAPPVSPNAAKKIATEFLVAHLGPTNSAWEIGSPQTLPLWTLGEMVLHRFSSGELWYYEIKMQPYVSRSYNWPAVTLFITMDGRVTDLHESK